MAVPKSWSLFRRFRVTVLSFAAVLCLLMNWSSYEAGQHFVSSILIYLMIVVKYTYWPDAARTVVLLGLHAAGTIITMMLKTHLPCDTFGGWSTCNTLTDVIIYGSWTITGLIGLYGIVLPFMAGLPPTIVADLEHASDHDVGVRPEEYKMTEEEVHPQSPTSADAQAWLLQNEKVSPKIALVDFPRSSGSPRGYSQRSSSIPSTPTLSQANARLLPEAAIDGDSGIAEFHDPGYRSRSRTSTAQTLRTDRPFTAYSDPYRDSTSFAFPSSISRRGNCAYAVVDGYESPSLYTQSSAAPSRSRTVTRQPVSQSHIGEDGSPSHPPIESIQDRTDVEQVEIASPVDGDLDPLPAALPIPDYASRRSAAPSFDFQLSDQSRPPSTNVGELLNMVGSRRRLHARQDSVASNVDMDEWRKLVLGAAGKV
ncbi:hypothetical protein EDD15DRAFT_2212318 [Pisolithus albus]|nr:hypothetical protein EDD15DRAFT_2212318 [Pisolithus albus]